MYSLLDAESYSGKRILIVGGGDSAVEAAMGLAHQSGNQVIISYRRAAFSRLKDRNEKRLEDVLKQGRLKVIFDSQPLEIRKGSVTLQVGDRRGDIPADFVWIFAGGATPKEFLEKIGIAFGRKELSAAAKVESEAAHAVA